MMSCSPLLSVVVPVYNVEKYLDHCVNSILNQTYKNIEIILIDDGSTDSSGKLCDDWANKNNRIQVVHKSNGGLVSARKAGTFISKGEYIAHVDSDDWIEDEMYAELLSFAVEHNADMVTSGYIKDFGDNQILFRDLITPGVYYGDNLNENLLSELVSMDVFFQTRISMSIVNKIYKKSLYWKAQEAVSETIKIGEDAAVTYPCLFNCKKIVVTDKCFYHYCMRNDSLTGVLKNNEEGYEFLRNILKNTANEVNCKVPSANNQMALVCASESAFNIPDKFFFVQNNELLPYTDVKIGDKILIYGAGKFGQRLYDFLKKYPKFNVVAWTDKKQRDGLISIKEALATDYDIIVLAILNATTAQNAFNELCSKGVPPNKIKRLDVTRILENSI